MGGGTGDGAGTADQRVDGRSVPVDERFAPVDERFAPPGPDVLRHMVDDMSAVVFVVDTDGRFQFLSPTSSQLLGYDASYLIGAPALDHVHPEDQELLVAALTDLLRPERETVPWDSPALDLRFRLPSGGWRNLEVSARLSPELGVIVGTAVRAEYRRHMEAFVRNLAALSPVDALLRNVVDLLDGEVPHGTAAIAYDWDGIAFAHVVGDLPRAMVGGRGLGEPVLGPWVTAMATGELVTATASDLPAPLRRLAEERDLHACWCQRIEGPGVPPGSCTIVWRDRDREPVFMQRVAFRHVADLVSLAFERRAHQEQLQHAATHDPLTGLANRSFLLERLAADLLAEGAGATLFFVDLDHFKPVNDTHGHAAGDAVLCEVADRLRAAARTGDLVGRLGGDEFALVVPEHLDALAVEALADRLVDVLGHPIRLPGAVVHVGATVGVAGADPGTATVEELLDAADRALYEGKAAGRQQWRLALPETSA